MNRAWHHENAVFSPEGRLFQWEFALEAISHSSPIIAMKTCDGIVMATKPRTPSSLGHPFQKIYKLSDSILCAVCGLVPDIELLLSYARQEVLRYRLTRNAEIPVIKLVQRLADVSQEYTRHKTLRPLSVGMTFGGHTDAEGFQLLSLEVATVMHWKATAYGHNHLSLRRFLESGFSEDITSKKAAELAYETFVKVSECTSPSQLQVVTLRKSSSAGAGLIEMEFLSTDKFNQLVGYNPSTEDSTSDNEISPFIISIDLFLQHERELTFPKFASALFNGSIFNEGGLTFTDTATDIDVTRGRLELCAWDHDWALRKENEQCFTTLRPGQKHTITAEMTRVENRVKASVEIGPITTVEEYVAAMEKVAQGMEMAPRTQT
ncbi:hypothetical protein FDECE_8813 [Fusarium decemcellulare]|nr:hypothetical protein FDECE_8813 [Fusarium decemcellulare]